LRDERSRESFFSGQGILDPFPIISLRSSANRYKDTKNLWLFRLSIFLANWSLTREIWKRRNQFDVLYVRDHLLIGAVTFAKFALRKPVIFESHYVLTKHGSQFVVELVARMADGIVAITKSLQEYYSRFVPRTIISYCAASEPQRFAKISDSVVDLRTVLNLPQEVTIICYTGNMARTGTGHSYGIEDIVHALPLLPEKFVFVGVGKKEGEHLPAEEAARELGVENRTLFRGWVAREEAARYVMAADILVVPASGAQPGNSPTKMFEYLAAGKPIVAANTEAITEVLHDRINALVVDYKNPEAWAEAVELIENDEKVAHKITEQALADSALYTWEKRGEAIAGFINAIFNEEY
jgi:glycosyltransferase involved in cell wall biosynthesis